MGKKITAKVYMGTIGFWLAMRELDEVTVHSIEELEFLVTLTTGVDRETAKLAVKFNDTPVLLGYREPDLGVIIPPDSLPDDLKICGVNRVGDNVYVNENGYWWPTYLEVAWFEDEVEEGR
jgi:hypothetical protein